MELFEEVKLTSVPKIKQCSNKENDKFNQEDDVETPFGTVHVAIQGDSSKHPMVTFHDLGLNHITCFQGFFSSVDMRPILSHFCVYHINAPGQHEGALQLTPDSSILEDPDSLESKTSLILNYSESRNFVYPSMDQLAEIVHHVVEHYGMKTFIGFGVGAGANVLARYELEYPERVDSLILANPTSGKSRWIEWACQKLNTWYLSRSHLTTFTEEYMLWHWFGKKTRLTNHDLVLNYQEHIKTINARNLAQFIESFLKRTDLGIARELRPSRKASVRTIRCRSLVLVGDDSPHMSDVVEMNGCMLPERTEFMKIADCGGMPLEEQPGKVCEALRLFLQGMGYAIKIPAHVQLQSVARKIALLHKIARDRP